MLFSEKLQDIDCAKYFAGVYLMIGLVGSALQEIDEDFDEDDDDKCTPVIILTVLNYSEIFFAELLYEHEVCQTYLESFKSVSYYII